ncbi:hypothetical protein CPB85DRAFT_1307553 [Mucidula mucida]|nr:hypothetical protein CPB85DRAFT_1307553 [Mucidula mucida]
MIPHQVCPLLHEGQTSFTLSFCGSDTKVGLVPLQNAGPTPGHAAIVLSLAAPLIQALFVVYCFLRALVNAYKSAVLLSTLMLSDRAAAMTLAIVLTASRRLH